MGLLSPGVWKDDRFLSLDRDERLVWIFVIAGPHAAGLPGLFELGPMTICEKMAEEFEFAPVAQRALEKFHSLGLAHLDRKKWIIRIPNAPRYNPPANPNHVRGWWRKWHLIPNVPIRYEHIADLRVVVDRIAEQSTRRDGAGWRSAWNETFGTVTNAHAPKQASLFYEVSKREESPTSKAFDAPLVRHNADTGSRMLPSADGSGYDPDAIVNESVCVSAVEDFDKVLQEDVAKRRIRNTHPDQDQIPDPRSQIRSPEGSAEGNTASVFTLPNGRLAEGTSPGVVLRVGQTDACERLWELQEDLRAPLTGGARARPTSANLADVAACLAEVGGDVETVETILRSFAVESRGYLIGGTNWKLSVFRIELAKLNKPKHAGGYYKPKEGQKFGDGKSVITRK